MNDENHELKNIILYRLFDCQSEEDYEKLFRVFTKIKTTFGEKVYYQVGDNLALVMRESPDLTYDHVLMEIYQEALIFATKELLGPDRDFDSWDYQLDMTKLKRFSWDYKFEASDFDAFDLDPQKVKKTVAVFNTFLHG